LICICQAFFTIEIQSIAVIIPDIHDAFYPCREKINKLISAETSKLKIFNQNNKQFQPCLVI